MALTELAYLAIHRKAFAVVASPAEDALPPRLRQAEANLGREAVGHYAAD